MAKTVRFLERPVLLPVALHFDFGKTVVSSTINLNFRKILSTFMEWAGCLAGSKRKINGYGSKRCQPLATTGFSLFFLLPIGFFGTLF